MEQIEIYKLKELSEVPDYLFWPFGILLIIFMCGLPIIYWFVVRPFDRVLEKKSVTIEHGVFYISALMRAVNYSRLIAFKNKPNQYDDSLYGDFDFKAKATRLQLVLSYAYLLMGNAAIVLLAIITFYRLL